MINQRRAGAILSYISLAMNAVIAFVYVPLLLRFLSTGEYGVYELIGSLIAYLSVMDMGLATTLNRFYVMQREKEGAKSVENLLAMAAIIYAILTAFAVLASLALDASLDFFLHESFSQSELNLAHQMMHLVAINCLVVLPGNWFIAVINANEQFVFARSMTIVKNALQVIFIFAVLSFFPNAVLVVVIQVFVNFLGITAAALYCFKRLKTTVRLYSWDWALAKSMFAFSGFILLNMLFDQLFWKTSQLILGAVVSASAVAIYGVVTKVITAGYMQVSTALSSVFLPKITALVAHTDDMEEINNLFCRIGRLQAILIWGVCGAFIVLGKTFLLLWAGLDFVSGFIPIVLLMIGLSIALIQNLGIAILQAKNKMGFRAIVYIVLAILNVIITIPAADHFGVLGCSVVTSVLLLIGTGPVMNTYYSKVIGIDLVRFYKGILPLVVPVAIASFATVGFCCLLPPEWSWVTFCAQALFFVVVYCAILWIFFLNDYEKGLVWGVWQKLRKS